MATSDMNNNTILECPFCNKEHELIFVESKKEDDVWWVRYLCSITGQEFTHYGASYTAKI